MLEFTTLEKLIAEFLYFCPSSPLSEANILPAFFLAFLVSIGLFYFTRRRKIPGSHAGSVGLGISGYPCMFSLFNDQIIGYRPCTAFPGILCSFFKFSPTIDGSCKGYMTIVDFNIYLVLVNKRAPPQFTADITLYF